MNATTRTIKYLQRQTAVKVSQAAPSNTDTLDEYIEVARTGGPKSRFLDEPVFVIDCHSTSSAKAYALAENVVSWLLNFADSDQMVSDVSVSSLFRNTWTAGSPCYSVTCSMTINI